MRTSVVLTAMNDQSSIMESTESVLSQAKLPDQFGVVLGPCYDRTDEFLQFYEDEFDFRLFCEQPDASRKGRSLLRLKALQRVNADFVLFVPADAFLFRNAVTRLEERAGNGEAPDMVFSGMSYIDYQDRVHVWRLNQLGASNILALGPINPIMTYLKVSTLRKYEQSLRTLECGPFTHLGWILKLLSAETARAKIVSERIAETWDFTEDEFCWDRSVFRSLKSLLTLVESIVPNEADRIRGWLDQGLNRQQLEGFEFGESDDISLECSDAKGVPWMEQTVPFPE